MQDRATVVYWFTDELEQGRVVKPERDPETGVLYILMRPPAGVPAAALGVLARELSVEMTAHVRNEWLHVGMLIDNDDAAVA